MVYYERFILQKAIHAKFTIQLSSSSEQRNKVIFCWHQKKSFSNGKNCKKIRCLLACFYCQVKWDLIEDILLLKLLPQAVNDDCHWSKKGAPWHTQGHCWQYNSCFWQSRTDIYLASSMFLSWKEFAVNKWAVVNDCGGELIAAWRGGEWRSEGGTSECKCFSLLGWMHCVIGWRSFPIFRLFRIATKFWWMVATVFYAESNGMFFFSRNEK